MTEPTAPGRWRSASLVAVLVVGIVAGAALTLVVQDRGAADDAVERRENASGTTGRPDDVAPAEAAPDPAVPTQQVLLAWRVEPLPADLAATVATIDGVERTTAVRHATVAFTGSTVDGEPGAGPAAGTAIPVDLVAVDPASYPSFVPADLASSFARLGPRDVVLGRTGARLRGLAVGASVQLAPMGTTLRPPITFTVVAVVDDVVIGGAELAVTTSAGSELGLDADRYLLVAHHGVRAAVEDQIRARLDGAVRFRGPGETPYLRDGDAVLPQVLIKDTFGEFAVAWGPDGVVQDPAWVDRNVVEADLPVLGRVRCHRAVIDDLRTAMEQIERERLEYLIDPTPSSQACFYPDIIDRTGALSRGFWGIAVALNSAKNPTGSGSVQDQRVVAILQENGFTWGGDFLVPEAAYFEYVGAGSSGR